MMLRWSLRDGRPLDPKGFDPTQILTDPANWTVWKQFLLFFGAILFVPVGTFISLEWASRKFFGLKHSQSQPLGAMIAVLVLQAFMFIYARRAVQEEARDYQAQQAAPPAEAPVSTTMHKPAVSVLNKATAHDKSDDKEVTQEDTAAATKQGEEACEGEKACAGSCEGEKACAESCEGEPCEAKESCEEGLGCGDEGESDKGQ